MGGYEAGELLGKCGGFWDTVEPCLCRDGYRSMGLMGWWWETEMSGNRHPFRVGPVREAYWETLGPIITSAPWAGEERLGEGKIEKRRGLSNRVHTHHPTKRLLFWRVTWASGRGLNWIYNLCPGKLLRSITSLCYLSKKQFHNGAHMCVMLVGSEVKATNLVGFLIWRAWHLGSQLHHRASQKFLSVDTEIWDW